MADQWDQFPDAPAALAGPSSGAGMLAPGNIDLTKRPKVRNPDGSISTVRSMSVNFDGREVLIPTVSDDGRVLSDDEAVQLYRKTGRHLGMFDTPQNATAYAERLHNDQARFYGAGQQQSDPWAQFPDAQAATPAPPDKRYESFGPVAPIARGIEDISNLAGDPFGVRDELVGAGRGVGAFLKKLVTSRGSLGEAARAYSQAYGEGRDEVREQTRAARETYGVLPEIVGGFGTAGIAHGFRLAPTIAGRVRQAAVAGGAYGGAAGAGHSEGGAVERLKGAAKGGALGATVGPVFSEVVAPVVGRTASAIGQGVRYARQSVRNARNPDRAAVETVADRLVAAGVDPTQIRAMVSPGASANLRARNFTDEDIAEIVSRGLRGEAATQIAQDFGVSPSTVTRYVNAYREANPTPMNIIDLSKELAGEGGATPIARLGRAAYSLSDEAGGEAAQRLIGRQETQAGRVSNIVQRSVAGGDFEATRAAGLRQLQDEADRAYRQFYQEPDLAIDQLGDLMADPLFRRANIMAQRQARVEAIRRNQERQRQGLPPEPVPTVDPNNEVFSPEMLDLIQRQLRIASEGAVSNPNNARHARNLREVFLDRIEQHYPTFRDIRRNYATALGEFGEEGALEAGAALTTNLGAPAREALRGFDVMTPAQQELFRLGFARRLMDMAANPQIGGAIANRFNTNAVREIVEHLYPRGNRQLWAQGQRLLRDLRREATTTRTRHDVLSGARTAELGSDMGRMMEGAQTAADAITGRWSRLLENLATRLTTQIGRRGAQEVLRILTETEPSRLLPLLNRLARAAQTSQERQAYVAAIRQVRSLNARRLSGITGEYSGRAMAQGQPPRMPSPLPRP